MRVFVPSTQAQRNLWIHSLQTAVSASAIAELGSLTTDGRGQAYLGGLMHDLGRFVLLYVARDNFDEVEEANWSTPEQLVEAEKMACGFDHAELGAIACKYWGLPRFVVELVRNHHRYAIQGNDTLNPHVKDLVVTVQMADLFSILMLRNPDFSVWEAQRLAGQIGKDCRHPKWTKLPVSPQALAGKAQWIDTESHRLVSALGLDR
jgi:HD-like signal output (HDOD) protein